MTDATTPAPIDGYRCGRCKAEFPVDDRQDCGNCGADLETRHIRVLGREAELVEPGVVWHAPESVWQAVLDSIAGFNRFGGSNVRIAWAPDLFMHAAGEWNDFSAAGTLIRTVREIRTIPKYPQIGDRWIIERWRQPETYGSPEDWAEQNRQAFACENFDLLGPYPLRGEYEHVFTFEHPETKQFARPHPLALEAWWRAVCEALDMNYRQRLANVKKRMEEKEKREDQIQSDRYDEKMLRPFYGVPHVSMAGPKSAGRRVIH